MSAHCYRLASIASILALGTIASILALGTSEGAMADEHCERERRYPAGCCHDAYCNAKTGAAGDRR